MTETHGKPRGVLVAGNWKMNLGPRETAAFFEDFRARASALGPAARAHLASGALVAAVFPPMLSLEAGARAAGQSSVPVAVGAQNVHFKKSGAFTGEISGPMLAELGLRWALVGHSERRQYFGETDETARQRAESLLEQGFRVILCIGESRPEREAGRTADVLTTQLRGAIPDRGKGVAAYLDGRCAIAYEPVWAIGTGLTASPEQAEEAHQLIRKQLWDRFGLEAAGRTQLLYGGSVTPDNADALLACPNVDGLLVGGASLKPESFATLLAAGARALG
jgi:triosephosphate isomerase